MAIASAAHTQEMYALSRLMDIPTMHTINAVFPKHTLVMYASSYIFKGRSVYEEDKLYFTVIMTDSQSVNRHGYSYFMFGV